MVVTCRSAGLTLQIDTPSRRWARFAREACAGQETEAAHPDVRVTISGRHDPFTLKGFAPLTRGAWSDGSSVVLQDACASGVDLLVGAAGQTLLVEARPRPAASTRALALLAPARAQLLWRAAMLQYPALWWAGVAGRVPLHVSALASHGTGVVMAGPGGVGKSTLLRDAMQDGLKAVSDNLCVIQGSTAEGLLEPLRTEGRTGRRMPHGRRESPWTERLESVEVRQILVIRRGSGERATVYDLPAGEAARVITAGTYAAGELRRYWAFASTLALGLGLGPAHPDVSGAANELVAGRACSEVLLPPTPGTRLLDLIPREDVPRAVVLTKGA